MADAALPPTLPDAFAATRAALHALAEHVLAAARHRATGRIGLRPTPGGFGTGPYGDAEEVRVEGVELIHRRKAQERRTVLTTLGDAARFVDVPLGAPADVYQPSTAADPDAPLDVDAASAAVLAAWYALGDDVLRALVKGRGDASPSEVQLWPEHFDLACDLGDEAGATRANYGFSPGDDAIAEPYVYVGPWDASRRTGRFGTYAWGDAMRYAELVGTGDPRSAAAAFVTGAADELLA
jgi:hypothetical protein